MAAHMYRALKNPYIRWENSWCLWKECAPFQSLRLRLMSSSSENSGSAIETPPKPSSSVDDAPNQTVVIENTLPHKGTGTQRNLLKYPSLLKSDSISSDKSFATLFRESNFAHLGDPKGKTVVGRIYRVVDDDLYVDFDWKFPCVVKRPTLDAHLYVNNAEVRLRILDLEMSTIFLGAEKETSLNEANCVLVGLINSPLGVPKSKEDFSSGFN